MTLTIILANAYHISPPTLDSYTLLPYIYICTRTIPSLIALIPGVFCAPFVVPRPSPQRDGSKPIDVAATEVSGDFNTLLVLTFYLLSSLLLDYLHVCSSQTIKDLLRSPAERALLSPAERSEVALKVKKEEEEARRRQERDAAEEALRLTRKDDNALHIAVANGNLAQVQLQLRKFDINAKGDYDGTALYRAAREGKTDIVKLLLSENADVNIPDVSKVKTIKTSPYILQISVIFYCSTTAFHKST